MFRFASSITLVDTFGTRLRYARTLRRLTQKELARACGLSQGAIGNYETDSRRSPKDIFRIADALKIDAAWLAMGTGVMEPRSAQRLEDFPASSIVWPFPEIDPARIWALSAQHRDILEKSLSGMLSALEEGPPGSSAPVCG